MLGSFFLQKTWIYDFGVRIKQLWFGKIFVYRDIFAGNRTLKNGFYILVRIDYDAKKSKTIDERILRKKKK